jgi:hypothetical protein
MINLNELVIKIYLTEKKSYLEGNILRTEK